MSTTTRFIMLAIAIAMGSIAWYNLTKNRPAVQGAPCVAEQGVKATADGKPVVCSQEMGWKPAQ